MKAEEEAEEEEAEEEAGEQPVVKEAGEQPVVKAEEEAEEEAEVEVSPSMPVEGLAALLLQELVCGLDLDRCTQELVLASPLWRVAEGGGPSFYIEGAWNLWILIVLIMVNHRPVGVDRRGLIFVALI